MSSEVLQGLTTEMKETVEAFRRELTRTRTGRASPALLEGLTVEYYGAKTPLNQVAGVSAPEPRLLLIQAYDRSTLGPIEKAIMQSDLGLTPVNDGKVLRVPIPELTEDRRRDLVKHVRKVGEDFRISLRSHRRDTIDLLKEMEKDKEISSDDLHRGQDKAQEITKTFTDQIDQVLKAKEDEIMEV
jgi:ribosome recycling factor